MGEKLRLLNFKASDEEIAAWDDHAHASPHRNRSRWIRETLNAAIGQPPMILVPRGVELIESKPAIAVAKELAERAVQKKTGEKCDNRLPKGAYCKQCGGIH